MDFSTIIQMISSLISRGAIKLPYSIDPFTHTFLEFIATDKNKETIKSYISDLFNKIIIFFNKVNYDKETDTITIEKHLWESLYDKLGEKFQQGKKCNILAYIIYHLEPKYSQYYINYINKLNESRTIINGINVFNTTQFGIVNNKVNFILDMKKTFDKLKLHKVVGTVDRTERRPGLRSLGGNKRTRKLKKYKKRK
jgi:hypothetical protein